jgi:DNA-binding IclR family transcriptional regulator
MGTITKALNLLTHFSSDRGEIGLASFVRLSGGDKATVRRHLVELEANGFLEQHPETRKYRLGPALLRLASVRERHFPIRSAIVPIVDQLAEELGELVHASLLQGEFMSPVYHHDPSRHGLRVIFDQGEMLPLHATSSGLAMMAFGPEGVIDTALSADMSSYAPNTVITRSDILYLISEIQKIGYGFSDQFFTRDIMSFGMPFFGPEGDAIGTLAVPLPQSRVTEEMKAAILSGLRDACTTITHSCGGDIPAQLQKIWNEIPDAGPPASAKET